MIYKHITAASAVNVYPNKLKKVIVQVNAALTGTLTVSDESGTTGSPVVAIITNPTVGSMYTYYALLNGVTITPSATCDITVSVDDTTLGQNSI